MRVLVRGVAVMAALIALVQYRPAQAEDYPTRPITLIAPWPAGGAVDTLCRIFAAKLTDRLGKSVVVENRPGAGSVLGVAATARAAPDGYTMVMGGSASLATTVTIYKKLPYDPTKDFAPLALITRIPFVLAVNAALPVNSLADLAKLARETPGGLAYASAGAGTSQHLSGVVLASALDLKLTHVPYKGMSPAINDVAGGHIPFMFSPIPFALPPAQAGKLRMLGVTTVERIEVIPDVAPLKEIGLKKFDAVSWFMLVAPAGTPGDVVERLHREVRSLTGETQVRQEFIRLGLLPVVSPPPDELKRFVAAEIVRWGDIVRKAGLAGSQ